MFLLEQKRILICQQDLLFNMTADGRMNLIHKLYYKLLWDITTVDNGNNLSNKLATIIDILKITQVQQVDGTLL